MRQTCRVMLVWILTMLFSFDVAFACRLSGWRLAGCQANHGQWSRVADTPGYPVSDETTGSSARTEESLDSTSTGSADKGTPAAATETAKQVATETARQVATETARQVAAETARQVATETARQVATETARQVAAETAKQVAEEMAKKVVPEPILPNVGDPSKIIPSKIIVEQPKETWTPALPEPPAKGAATSGSPPGAADVAMRIWKDSTGRYATRARLTQVVGGELELLKENGDLVRVPMDRLSLADRQFVAESAYGQVRTWQDETGRHATRARLAQILDGEVRLLKESGECVVVPLGRLSFADRQFVAESARLAQSGMLSMAAH